MEVREFDWDSSRKGASQLPRTKTIRLSTQKTTTGENLIFGYTSPLSLSAGGVQSFSAGSFPIQLPQVMWFVHMCWFICVCMCVYVCMCMCACVCACIRARACLCVSVHVCVCVHVPACM